MKLNDINFVNINARDINLSIIKEFEAVSGETLYPGDERRIFLQQLTPLFVALKNDINDSAKQNLLRFSRGNNLDVLGEDLYYTKRLDSKKASCKCKCKLSKVQNTDVIVPKNTRVSPDSKIYFYIREDILIKSGELEAIGIIDAEKTGPQYNSFIPGQINLMVDLIPFLDSIENIEMSAGGSDIENDEKYIDRCRLSQESTSTAGPNDAYIYLAKSAHTSVKDAYPDSPSPGVVRIVILLEDATQPSQEILSTVLNYCSSKDRRPLTDHVQVVACEEVSYDINLTYYLDKNHACDEIKYRKQIEGNNLDFKTGAIRDYINWQKCRLGNDINSDELRYRIQDAATYTTTDNNKFTAVRKIELESPKHISLTKTQVAKINNINVNYGGLD